MKATFNAPASPIYLASRKERFGIRHAQCLSRPVSVGNYSPFGVTLHNRDLSLTSGTGAVPYRYAYQGSEMDNEVKGDGNSYDFGARMLDPRIGRWLTIDPVSGKYPSIAPYVFCINAPVRFIDPNGKWIVEVIKNTETNKYELSFLAEEGDNLATLSTQLGLSQKEILENHPELNGLTICSDDRLKLEKLEQVAAINNGINFIGDHQSTTNCSALADHCDGGSSLTPRENKNGGDVENYENKIASTYIVISDSKDAQIGDVITYRLTQKWRDEEMKSGAERNAYIIKVRFVQKHSKN